MMYKMDECPLCKKGIVVLDYVAIDKDYYVFVNCKKTFLIVFVEDSYNEELEDKKWQKEDK